MVSSAVNFNGPVPTERLWSYAQGWLPMSHIRAFGGFYAPVVHLLCPLIGFAVFWVLSRHEGGISFWTPMAIALLFTMPPSVSDPWVVTARTILIVLLMVWRSRRDPARLPVPASP
jgi:hypothetical protein